MAGLGEACSHVGAVLFACEAAVRIQQSLTCTQEANKWLPTHVKKIPYLPVSCVDFTSAKRKYQQLGDEEKENASPSFRRKKNVVSPTKQEKMDFLKKLHDSKTKCAVLSVIPPYNKSFKPVDIDLPSPLTALYNEENTKLSYLELVKNCGETSISITPSQCQNIEMQTRMQAASKVWFQHRSGRITASKLKSACDTNPDKPSKSLIKGICYPEAHKFSTAATRYLFL